MVSNERKAYLMFGLDYVLNFRNLVLGGYSEGLNHEKYGSSSACIV